jgi:hypothetical protein
MKKILTMDFLGGRIHVWKALTQINLRKKEWRFWKLDT